MPFKKLLLLTLGLCFFLTIKADDYTVTVRGSIFGLDWSNNPQRKFALAGARVELMDSDADGSQLFDDVMGTAIVNLDGSFEVTGIGGDPGSFSWSKPDIYVRFVHNYKGKVRLTDELDRTRYVNTPEHDHNNFEGVLSIGSWVIGTDITSGQASKCGVWNQVAMAWDNYLAIMGEEPKSGKCDVEYWSAIYSGTPWANVTTIHWPVHYSSNAAPHEFGHIIRHSFDGDADHFTWDVTRFRYARAHSVCDTDCSNWSTESKEIKEAYAFNEGWAHFWKNAGFPCIVEQSTECEGGVRWILKALEDSIATISSNPRKFMCNVLKNNPGAIHSISEYISKINQEVGKRIFSINSIKLPTTSTMSSIELSISKEVATAYAHKSVRDITSAINNLNTIISENTKSASAGIACRGEACNTAGDRLVNLSAAETQRNILLLQKEMLQKSVDNNYYDELPKKIVSKTLDVFKKDMRSYYNKKINDINLGGFKNAISRLQKIRRSNSYITSLIKVLQNKMKQFENETNDTASNKLQGYKPYDPETVKRL